jgi:hypothetical protein
MYEQNPLSTQFHLQQVARDAAATAPARIRNRRPDHRYVAKTVLTTLIVVGLTSATAAILAI